MARPPRKRKRRRGEQPKKRKGVMIGMRSGFKKAATAVTGSGAEKAASKKATWLSTAFTVLLLVAALAFVYFRRMR